MKSLINWKKSLPFFSDRANNFFLNLQKEMDKAINHFYDFFGALPFHPADMQKLIFNPAVDIVEDDKNFKVVVEMPGVSTEDINVEINEMVLSIKGKKKISRKDEEKHYVLCEIGYGTYERTIFLPGYVKIDKGRASCKKGILWVSFPKKPMLKNNALN